MSGPKFHERVLREQERLADAAAIRTLVKSRLSFDPADYRRAPSRLLRPAIAFGACAAAVLVLVLVFGALRNPHPLTARVDGREATAGDWILGGGTSPTVVSFSDGSSVELEGSAGVRLHALSVDGAALHLENGALKAQIVHKDDTRWTVNAGPFTIAVRGTRFEAAWSPEAQVFRLRLKDGAVDVKGPLLPDGRRMAAGETLTASLSPEQLRIEKDSPLETVAARGESALETSTPAQRSPSPPVSSFASSATKPSTPKISAADLMLEGDAARRRGDLSAAVRTYKAVRRRFPNTAHASGAAFSLGTMAFDQSRDYAEAARWFRACLSGPFAREASGRLIEALLRSKDDAAAVAAARDYLLTYPAGPHARLAKKVVDGR